MSEIDDLEKRIAELEAIIADAKVRANEMFTRAIGVETRTEGFNEAHGEAAILSTEATALVAVLDG